jgi:hypothetical protein
MKIPTLINNITGIPKMKTFAQYLTESARTHDYRIKIVGEIPQGFLAAFKDQLKKFDPASVGDVKKTPVTAQPKDFPAFTNESVSMMDVSFRYPATMPQIQEMAKLLGLDPDRLCVTQRDYAEGMDQELLGIEEQKDLLTSDYPADSAEQKQLKKDHASGNQQVVKNSAADAVWTVAGGKTKPAETTNDLPMGVTSPMSKITRPAKPATGFRK